MRSLLKKGGGGVISRFFKGKKNQKKVRTPIFASTSDAFVCVSQKLCAGLLLRIVCRHVFRRISRTLTLYSVAFSLITGQV